MSREYTLSRLFMLVLFIAASLGWIRWCFGFEWLDHLDWFFSDVWAGFRHPVDNAGTFPAALGALFGLITRVLALVCVIALGAKVVRWDKL